ncbi:hypothetical protein Vretifemale_14978 [Volvox reticuliferus]|uniref:Dienelactone hydrolase domain-containing protein n=1 Tax=Volvox reticuliferus TaxID=1737510 RepID=A0A8J4CQ96_9CHLO|nr:hypothetical protein Vretifemale_14978 [Volvox reticuliferus]
MYTKPTQTTSTFIQSRVTSLNYLKPSLCTQQQLRPSRLTARRICLHPLGGPHPLVNTCKALPLDNLPGEAVAAALVLSLPASVLLDEFLDTVVPRVNAITNEESNGVRFFVARPGTGTSIEASNGRIPESGTSPKTRTAVILIHQILGLQKRETELAQALADEEGVVAVAPDTFRGQSTLWPFRAIALGFKYALRDGASWGVESVHETVRWLKAQPDVDPDRIVVAGFCYGGGAAIRYAAAHPGEIAGVAVFYGRPLLEAAEVAKLGNTPVLGMYGTRDSQFPKAMLDKFKVGAPFTLFFLAASCRSHCCPAPAFACHYSALHSSAL